MTNNLIFACVILLGTNACNGSRARTPAASTSAVTPVAPPAPVQSASAVPQPSASSVAPVAPTTAPHTWSFDGDATDAPPVGFSFGRTGSGKAGRWVVLAEKGAPSGANVLAQTDVDNTDYRFPIAVANAPLLRDGSVNVRCKPVSGRVDQACGLYCDTAMPTTTT